jgi:hypothetical protein
LWAHRLLVPGACPEASYTLVALVMGLLLVLVLMLVVY